MRSSSAVSPEKIFDFVRTHRLAVVATVSEHGMREAALIGIVMLPDRRIMFDTVRRSRKYSNVRHRGAVALVVGWEHETTVQLEGHPEEPTGVDLERCKHAYFAAFPDALERQDWPDIAYVAVRVTWMRYSDFSAGGSGVVEYTC